MIDYYKILNVSFGASETEIKKRFRQLASIYHPDKNAGSKKSEEAFKVILNAYETLSDKEKRTIYNLRYTQQFHHTKTDPKNQNTAKSSTKKEPPKQPSPRNGEYQRTEEKKLKVNYRFLLLLVLLVLLYFFNINKKTTTGNVKADKQLEEQEQENRPQSGELYFNK